MRERTELVLLRVELVLLCVSIRSTDPADSATDLTVTKRRRKNDSC